MRGPRSPHAVEHMIQRLGRPTERLRDGPEIFASSSLNHLRGNALDLPPQHAGNRHGDLRVAAVVAVGQRLGQHVRPGQSELQRLGRQRPGELVIGGRLSTPSPISSVTTPAGAERKLIPWSARKASMSLIE